MGSSGAELYWSWNCAPALFSVTFSLFRVSVAGSETSPWLPEPSGLEPSGLEPLGLELSGLEPSGLEPSGRLELTPELPEEPLPGLEEALPPPLLPPPQAARERAIALARIMAKIRLFIVK